MGTPDAIRAAAAEAGVDLAGCELVDPKVDPRRVGFIDDLWARRARQGVTRVEAERRMRNRLDFSAMLLTSGEVGGIRGGDRPFSRLLRHAGKISRFGLQPA